MSSSCFKEHWRLKQDFILRMQIFALFLEVSKNLTSMKEVNGFDILIVKYLDFLFAILYISIKSICIRKTVLCHILMIPFHLKQKSCTNLFQHQLVS